MNKQLSHRRVQVGIVDSLLMFFSALFLPSVAISATSPDEFLDDFLHSDKRGSYSASFVFIKPSGLQSTDVFVDMRDDGTYKRIIWFNGAKKEMTSTPLKTMHYFPAKQEKVSYLAGQLPSRLTLLFNNYQQASHYYSIKLDENAEYVAGRETYRLSVMAKLPNRYSRVYWIDKAKFIILRVDVLDENGQLIERMKCTSLVLKKPDSGELLVSSEGIGYKAIELIPDVTEGPNNVITFNWLPEHYKIVQSLRVDKINSLEKHIMLSDGFSIVRVVVSPHGHHTNKIAANHQRDVWQKFVFTLENKQILLTGELPLHSIKEIAGAISH
ncbi:MAG: hypothetical protein COB62_04550 [Piscirickettsiaceae bacterium]|nr:MAG: hypothetical protein COB62_04550 [Piscirickettsiaceae bacterium]